MSQELLTVKSKAKSGPLYDQISRHFRREIEANRISHLEALPPVSAVAKQFKVNYRTARQAYRVLEDMGMVKMEGGRVQVVRSKPQNPAVECGNIAVVSYNPDITSLCQYNFYSSAIFHSVSDAASRSGFTVQSITLRDKDGLSRLLEGSWAGIIFEISSTAHVDGIPLEKLEGIPKVFLDPVAEGQISVEADNTLGVELAMDHLYELGHRKIALLMGSLRDVATQLRFDAYCSSMQRYSLQIEPNWINQFSGYCFDDSREQERVYRKLFVDGPAPTAVFCAQHFGALGLLSQLHRNGVSVPEDVSIVAYDDTPSAIHAFPPLTVIRQPLDQLGVTAVEALSKMIRKDGEVSDVLLAPELVIRESTGPTK